MTLKLRWWRRGMAGAVISAVSGYGRQRISTRFVVEQVPVPVTNLPAALHGFTIVHLSDFHFSPHTSRAFIERVVAQTNALQPDVVALTGDYSWRSPLLAYELANILGALRPRLGSFAARGNHDFLRPAFAAPIEEYLAAAGIPMLVNCGITIQKNGAQLYLAGLDNFSRGTPDLRQALAAAPPLAPVVLLVHEPDVALWTAEDERVTLQLSGHTHGGQIRLPGGRPLILPDHGRLYYAGLHRVRQTWVYTTRGIGVTRIPLRLNCPPEITRLTLVPTAAPSSPSARSANAAAAQA